MDRAIAIILIALTLLTITSSQNLKLTHNASTNISTIQVQQVFTLPDQFNAIYQIPEHEQRLSNCEKSNRKISKHVLFLESQLACLITNIRSRRKQRECPCGGCNEKGRCIKDEKLVAVSPLLGYKCHCKKNFSGKHCEIVDCDKCIHGNCDKNGKCICDQGWSGKSCNKRKCPNDCSGHGKCNRLTGKCKCRPAYRGLDCSSTCDAKLCQNKGHKCVGAVCICKSDQWYGKDCAFKKCKEDCGLHGQCVLKLGRCMCHDGWEGEKCDKVTGPTDLKVSKAGEKSVDVSWKQSKLVEGNEISCVPNSGNANAVYMSVGPNITQVTIQDLESGTEYTVYVYSKIEDQLSQAATTTFKTL